MLTRFQGSKGQGPLLQAFCDQQLVGGERALAVELVAKAKLVAFKAGDRLMTQGGTDNDIYFLLCGEVQVLVYGTEIGHRRAKVHVGEMALIEPAAVRSATIVATQDTVAAMVSEADFVAIADAHPKMWRALAVEIAERLRQRGRMLRKRNEVPVVFVGSSSEALPVAAQLHAALLRPSAEVRLWTFGVFKPSNFPIEDLEGEAQQSDFAVLVASADDTVISRRKKKDAPRDNVIFELGLFMGACGRKRTFLVQPVGRELKLPSDLSGVTTIRYDEAKVDWVQAPAREILEAIAVLGPR